MSMTSVTFVFDSLCVDKFSFKNYFLNYIICGKQDLLVSPCNVRLKLTWTHCVLSLKVQNRIPILKDLLEEDRRGRSKKMRLEDEA